MKSLQKKNNKLNISEDEYRLLLFNNMISKDYLDIHGYNILTKLFSYLTHDHLKNLIDLYKQFPLLRSNKIGVYLENHGLISDDLNNSFVVRMYINALQHFIDG